MLSKPIQLLLLKMRLVLDCHVIVSTVKEQNIYVQSRMTYFWIKENNNNEAQ